MSQAWVSLPSVPSQAGSFSQGEPYGQPLPSSLVPSITGRCLPCITGHMLLESPHDPDHERLNSCFDQGTRPSSPAYLPEATGVMQGAHSGSVGLGYPTHSPMATSLACPGPSLLASPSVPLRTETTGTCTQFSEN